MQRKEEIETPGYLKISKIVIWFLYFYILLGIISLAFRTFLVLFGADRTAGFYKLVDGISSDYLQPFRGIFPPKPVSQTGYLDISALFAILVYLILLWGLHSLINYVQDKIDISRARQEKELEALRQTQRLPQTRPRKTI